MSSNLKDLLKEVVIPGIITIGLVGTACYLAIVGREIPEWLYAFGGMGMGYFLNYATTSRTVRSVFNTPFDDM